MAYQAIREPAGGARNGQVEDLLDAGGLDFDHAVPEERLRRPSVPAPGPRAASRSSRRRPVTGGTRCGQTPRMPSRASRQPRRIDRPSSSMRSRTRLKKAAGRVSTFVFERTPASAAASRSACGARGPNPPTSSRNALHVGDAGDPHLVPRPVACLRRRRHAGDDPEPKQQRRDVAGKAPGSSWRTTGCGLSSSPPVRVQIVPSVAHRWRSSSASCSFGRRKTTSGRRFSGER